MDHFSDSVVYSKVDSVFVTLISKQVPEEPYTMEALRRHGDGKKISQGKYCIPLETLCSLAKA